MIDVILCGQWFVLFCLLFCCYSRLLETQSPPTRRPTFVWEGRWSSNVSWTLQMVGSRTLYSYIIGIRMALLDFFSVVVVDIQRISLCICSHSKVFVLLSFVYFLKTEWKVAVLGERKLGGFNCQRTDGFVNVTLQMQTLSRSSHFILSGRSSIRSLYAIPSSWCAVRGCFLRTTQLVCRSHPYMQSSLPVPPGLCHLKNWWYCLWGEWCIKSLFVVTEKIFDQLAQLISETKV